MKDFNQFVNLCKRPYTCITVINPKNPSQYSTGFTDQYNKPFQKPVISIPNGISYNSQNNVYSSGNNSLIGANNGFGSGSSGVGSSSAGSGYNINTRVSNTQAPSSQHQIMIEKIFTPTYSYNHGSYSFTQTPSKKSYQDILKKTSNPPHGKLLIDQKEIGLSNSGLKDSDIGVLVQSLQYQELNLYKFDVSNNSLGNSVVENLFYTFRLGSSTATYNIKFMNLSNNQIGDDGAKYIASHLGNGLHPNLKSLDVSGNQITPTGYSHFAEGMKSTNVKNFMVTFVKQATSVGKDIN